MNPDTITSSNPTVWQFGCIKGDVMNEAASGGSSTKRVDGLKLQTARLV